MKSDTCAAIRTTPLFGLQFTKNDAPADSAVCLHALLCWMD